MFSNYPGLLANVSLLIGLFLLARNLDERKVVLRFLFAGLAIFLNVRYFYWRLTFTMDPFLSSAESIWQWAFFVAELIALFSLSLHLVILVQRPRTPKEKGIQRYVATESSPRVEVFIATYNEGENCLDRPLRRQRTSNTRTSEFTFWTMEIVSG